MDSSIFLVGHPTNILVVNLCHLGNSRGNVQLLHTHTQIAVCRGY